MSWLASRSSVLASCWWHSEGSTGRMRSACSDGGHRDRAPSQVHARRPMRMPLNQLDVALGLLDLATGYDWYLDGLRVQPPCP
jgi:hypothetical protein